MPFKQKWKQKSWCVRAVPFAVRPTANGQTPLAHPRLRSGTRLFLSSAVFSLAPAQVWHGTVTLHGTMHTESPPMLAQGWNFWISQVTHSESADSPCCRPTSFPALWRSTAHLLTNLCSTVQPGNNSKTCTRCITLSSSTTYSDSW